MYRAGPLPGGLPLPRMRLGAFTAAVAVVAVLAFLVPWLLLFDGGASNAWVTFRNGGIGMWLIALLDVVLPIALGITGAVAVRGKRVPAGLFFGVAAIPLLVSLFFGYLTHRAVDGLLVSASIDPSQAIGINAAAMSEMLSLDIFGGFVTCGCAMIGGVALACAVGSIDLAAAARADTERTPATFGAATLVSAAAWFVATIVLTAMRIRLVGGIAITVVLVVGALVPFVVLAARTAPVLRAWHDPLEARRAGGALFVAGLTGMLAVLVLERALCARVASHVFDAVSGESVSPVQRMRILVELVDTRRFASVAYGVHGVLGTVTFALALAGAIGPARAGGGFRHPISPSTVMAASAGVFVLAAVFALNVARTGGTARIAAMAEQGAAKQVTLPLVDADTDTEGFRSSLDGSITLRADGAAEPPIRVSNLACVRHGSVSVTGDRMATLAMLSKWLPDMNDCKLGVTFVVAIEKNRELEARLGDLAPFVRGDTGTIATTFDSSFAPARPAAGFLTVRSLADETIEYEGHRVKLPLDAASPPVNSSRYELVRYVFEPTDTIGHVVRVIVAMRRRFGPSVAGEPTIEIARPVAADDATRWAGKNVHLPKGIRFEPPTVSGRLAPEIIVRVVRSNASRIQTCYAEGLKRDPKLAGAVRVKFVIDRAGSVSTAQDAASTLPDRDVVACITRAFGNLTFAQPEGGIVTVTYPMKLAPDPAP